MTKTIVYKNLRTNVERVVTKQFTDINEADDFARANCKRNEYIGAIL